MIKTFQILYETSNLTLTEEDSDGLQHEGSASLGNQPGDGPRFRGRGIIPIRGRHMYKLLADGISQDLEGKGSETMFLSKKYFFGCSYDSIRSVFRIVFPFEILLFFTILDQIDESFKNFSKKSCLVNNSLIQGCKGMYSFMIVIVSNFLVWLAQNWSLSDKRHVSSANIICARISSLQRSIRKHHWKSQHMCYFWPDAPETAAMPSIAFEIAAWLWKNGYQSPSNTSSRRNLPLKNFASNSKYDFVMMSYIINQDNRTVVQTLFPTWLRMIKVRVILLCQI